MLNNSLTCAIFLLIPILSSLAQTPEEQTLPETFAGIPKAPEPPVIDGNLDEWELSTAIFVSEVGTQPLRDCSGVFYMMWDEANLYFAAKVYDHELVQGKEGDDIHMEDDVQFDLDLDREGDREIFEFTDDDFQLGFSPGDFHNEGPELWGWNPGRGQRIERPQNSDIASSEFHGGWIIEARIGLNEFNADLIGLEKFQEGMKIGFGRCINDYDTNTGGGGVSSGGAWMETSKMYDVELIGPFSVTPQRKLIQSWALVKTAKGI
jgi:hypothetical protein